MAEQLKIIPMADGSKAITAEDVKPTVLPDAYLQSSIARSFKSFHMPRYRDLPAVPLYRDQVIALVEEVLSPLNDCAEGPWLTPSMVNNYVKMKLVGAPVKKQYGRDQVAGLISVCIFKQFLPISAIAGLLKIQSVTYTSERAYNYLASELERALHSAFTAETPSPDTSGHVNTRESLLVQSGVSAFVSKAYLMGYLKFTGLE